MGSAIRNSYVCELGVKIGRNRFLRVGVSFEFGGGHTPLPLSCYTTLLEGVRGKWRRGAVLGGSSSNKSENQKEWTGTGNI